MKDAITNFLTMQPQNMIPQIGIMAILVWVVVVVCSIFSVLSQKLGKVATGVWIGIIVAVPLVGLFAYCLYCFTKVEFTMFPAFAGWQRQLGGDKVLGAAPELWASVAGGAPSHDHGAHVTDVQSQPARLASKASQSSRPRSGSGEGI